MTDMSGSQVRLQFGFVFKLLFTIISIKKNQKEQLSPVHKVPHKCKNSLLKISWLMMVEYE